MLRLFNSKGRLHYSPVFIVSHEWSVYYNYLVYKYKQHVYSGCLAKEKISLYHIDAPIIDLTE